MTKTEEELELMPYFITVLVIILIAFIVMILICNSQSNKLKELQNRFDLCKEGFGTCYFDLKECIIEKYNMTEKEFDTFLNLFNNLNEEQQKSLVENEQNRK